LTISEDRVRKGVQKLNKSKATSTQGRLDSFFKPIPKTEEQLQKIQKRKADEKAKEKAAKKQSRKATGKK
jgi:flap endonuclease-1